MNNETLILDELNRNLNLDYTASLNTLIENEDGNPYHLYNINSTFHDNLSFSSTFKSSKNPIFLNLNIQSLPSKHPNLESFISEIESSGTKITLIALQETWNIPNLNLVNIPNFNLVFKKRAKFRGGGVGFYIKQGVSWKILEHLSIFKEKIFECLSLELNLNNKKILVSSVYRTPSVNTDHIHEFYTEFDHLMSEMSLLTHDSFIFTDSNINLLKLNQSPSATNLIENAMQYGFIQTISKATRIFNDKISLIDQIFTNTKQFSLTSGVIINDISDHFTTFLQPSLPLHPPKQKPILKRDMSRQNMIRFRDDLRNLNWRDVLNCNDVNVSYNLFWQDFKSLYDIHFPLKSVRFNKNLHGINKFMTRGLLISRITKIKLLKQSVKNPNIVSSEAYRKYRNIFNSVLRASKKLYYKNQLENNSKNPRKIWDLIKEVSTGKKSNHTIEKIQINGESVENKQEIAEHFNKFFAKIGKEISDSVTPISKNPADFVNSIPNTPNLVLGNTGPVHVTDFIKAFEPKKSLDLDGLSMQLLKFISVEISTPLAHIFNLSLELGVFPEALKQSRTVPIFKAGNDELCDNYRPISLQNSIAKILEKMVSTQLVNHLEINNLIYKHQYGFMRGKSTEHNLLHVTNTIGKALNEGKFCIGLFLDLRKAFDVCSHEILLMKLKKLGVTGTALNWFQSYLTNRSQQVDINGNISTPQHINISVLQGSILGPILFLCYINDLPNATELLTFLFADDTSGLLCGDNLNELIIKMNLEINKLANWFRANKMALNVSKTKFIIFHTKGKKFNFEENSIVYNENEIGKPVDLNLITPLERIHDQHPQKDCRAYKLLGVHLDETLSFQFHANFLHNKLSKALFCINRAKNFLDAKSLKMLYFALFHSNLIYCIGTLSSMSKSNATKIEKIQNKAIRAISLAKYRDPVNPLYHELNILPYNLLQKQVKLHFMHSIEYKYAPKSFLDTWQKNTQRNLTYQLRNNDLFYTPLLNYEHLKNIPFFSFPSEWNNLNDLRFQTNKITFQIALKNALLDELSPSIPPLNHPPPSPSSPLAPPPP